MSYFKLLRINQWYKNLVIFLPLIFAEELFNIDALILSSIGFFVLCFVSSSAYIINDIVDRNKDRAHPEKRFRSIASGKIGIFKASLTSIILLFIALIIANQLNSRFFYASAGIYIIMFVYSFWLKNEAFADILTIAVNFVLRAVAGALVINVKISPWLILCTFFLSLFLSIGKRKSDLLLLKDKAIEHKEVFKYYDDKILNLLLITSNVTLIISYSLYSFLSNYQLLIISLPFAAYVIFRYTYFIQKGDIIARQPGKAIMDKKLVLGIFLWLFSALVIVYQTKIFL
jgi:4-hydroxybenzoate polyprenyltransferase